MRTVGWRESKVRIGGYQTIQLRNDESEAMLVGLSGIIYSTGSGYRLIRKHADGHESLEVIRNLDWALDHIFPLKTTADQIAVLKRW